MNVCLYLLVLSRFCRSLQSDSQNWNWNELSGVDRNGIAINDHMPTCSSTAKPLLVRRIALPVRRIERPVIKSRRRTRKKKEKKNEIGRLVHSLPLTANRMQRNMPPRAPINMINMFGLALSLCCSFFPSSSFSSFFFSFRLGSDMLCYA